MKKVVLKKVLMFLLIVKGNVSGIPLRQSTKYSTINSTIKMRAMLNSFHLNGHVLLIQQYNNLLNSPRRGFSELLGFQSQT